MKIQSFLICSVLMFFGHFVTNAQKGKQYDLQKLLSENKLEAYGDIAPLAGDDKKAVSCSGIAWLKDVSFSEGTIEIDLRGKDVFQQSFLGVAFHGVDSSRYDAIYFRPFNFQSKDSVRKIHAVQYISEPEYPWDRLRKEHNGVYEKAVTPVPDPNSWFHARIVVKDGVIKVYVNNSQTPSLTVKKLNARKNGKIGIWSSRASVATVQGNFANLTITK